jgi:replicative DNA helicase
MNNDLVKFVDPDGPKVPAEKYKWDQEFQREMLALLMSDRVFALECRALIQPSYFTSESHIMLCGILFEYFDKYHQLPQKSHVVEEIRRRTEHKGDESLIKHVGEFNALINFYVPGLGNRDYYSDKVTNFAKAQSLKVAFHRSLELMKKEPESESTWDKIHGYLRDAITVEHNFDLGQDYFADVEERYRRREEVIQRGEIFTSGFETIDAALKNGGLLRGEMGSWCGLSGTGKSLALVHAAKCNVLKGKKVLYISLEIDQDAVAERFDAQFADPKKQHDITTRNLIQKKDLVIEGLNQVVDEYDDKRILVIKQFPGGQLGVAEFRAYFSQICLRGFRPDLVIVDYLGEMKDYVGVDKHESRYMITRDLRGFAVEEQVCLLTAMQPNRSAKEAVRNGLLIDDENLADAFAQIKPLDALWTINQMQTEKECSLARGFIAKHREGKSKVVFHMQFDYDTLALKEISQKQYNEIHRTHRMQRKVAARDETIDDAVDGIIGRGRGAIAPVDFEDIPGI